MIERILIHTQKQGLTEFTNNAQKIVTNSGIVNGLVTFYVQHTSASLLIQENADVNVRHDLQYFFNKIVPTGDTNYTHIEEGLDDMPSHIKSALTQTSISVPIIDGILALGTWQGIFLWEHRTSCHHRTVIIHIA